MKTKKTYKELTIGEWQRRLRDGGADSLGKLAVADTIGRSPTDSEWRETNDKLRKIVITTEGHLFYVGNYIPWLHLALVEEETAWEVGDTVEVIADKQCAVTTQTYLRAGAKGIVVAVDYDHYGPKVRQTSPDPFGDGAWYTPDDNLRPWTPGYGYMPDGNRVPEPPEGWEFIAEGDSFERDETLAFAVVTKWEGPITYDGTARLNPRFTPTTQTRAYARRKKQTLQIREGAYYRRRDGKVIESPAANRSSYSDLRGEFPWEVGGDWYTNTGSYYGEAGTDFRDLVEEVPDPTPKLQIREGAYYRNRQGEVVGPMRWRDMPAGADYPWTDQKSETYGAHGAFFVLDRDEHPRDLVEEVPAPKPQLQIQEGCFYRNGEGEVVGPAKRYDHHIYRWQVGRFTYTDSGLILGPGARHPGDLVEEVPEPTPKLQIREGAYYRMRSGEITKEPVRKSGSCSRPWTVGYTYYTDEGFHHFKGYDPRAETIESEYDLVEEVPAPKLQIREGAHYRSRNGEVMGPAKRRPNVSRTYKWLVGNRTFTDDGWFLEHAPGGPYDLVEEVPAPPKLVPDWEECNKKRNSGQELTPLEYFIYEHTPCRDEYGFHLDLGEAVKFLTEERVVGKD